MSNLFTDRYLRNKVFSVSEQSKLAKSKVFILGLGGLGGHCLDMLIRAGVGEIVAADGDVFEESNLNRQLLCTEQNIGRYKAEVAREYVKKVNSQVKINSLPKYLKGPELTKQLQGCDLALDCLGGLADRLDLENSAKKCHIPLVSAGIAGFVGWIAVLQPDSQKLSPISLMCQKTGETKLDERQSESQAAEDSLGNLAPTVALAASLQVSEALKILTGKKSLETMLIFDLFENSFTHVEL